jgi:hypothetical protein
LAVFADQLWIKPREEPATYSDSLTVTQSRELLSIPFRFSGITGSQFTTQATHTRFSADNPAIVLPNGNRSFYAESERLGITKSSYQSSGTRAESNLPVNVVCFFGAALQDMHRLLIAKRLSISWFSGAPSRHECNRNCIIDNTM